MAMNIQIFGKSKCFDTKKAERYFKERRIKFQSIDLPRYGMSRREFDSVRSAVGLDAMIDTNSDAFQNADSQKRQKSDCGVLSGNMEAMGKRIIFTALTENTVGAVFRFRTLLYSVNFYYPRRSCIRAAGKHICR